MQSTALRGTKSMMVTTTIFNHSFPLVLSLSWILQSLVTTTTNFDAIYLLLFSNAGNLNSCRAFADRYRHKAMTLLDCKILGLVAVSSTSPTRSSKDSSRLNWWDSGIGEDDTQLLGRWNLLHLKGTSPLEYQGLGHKDNPSKTHELLEYHNDYQQERAPLLSLQQLTDSAYEKAENSSPNSIPDRIHLRLTRIKSRSLMTFFLWWQYSEGRGHFTQANWL